MTRLLWGLVALVLLTVLAGCSGGLFGGGEVDQEALAANETYDWNTTATTTLTIEREAVRAVYTIDDQSTIEAYAFRRFNNERPVDPIALRFRYPNGTVVGHEAMAVSKTNSRTLIELPADQGQVAMKLPKTGKRVRAPVVVDGSHEVILPENTDVQYFLLGRVAPRADERVLDPDGRVHLRWNDISADRIVVEYYLERDLIIFASILVIASVLLVGGAVYFWLQLRTLRERRESVALDSGDGSGPP